MFKVTIKFNSNKQANEFATAYSRITLRGHTIADTTVFIYDITDEDKIWIDSYVSNLNIDMDLV